MVSASLLAILLERLAYRPLRRAPRLVPLITAIGASLFISNSVRGLYGEQVRAYPRLDVFQGYFFEGWPFQILRVHAIVIVAATLLMVVLYWFVEKTRTGRAMRADQRGQGHRGADGHQRRPDHRGHLRHRRSAGRRGGRPLRASSSAR